MSIANAIDGYRQSIQKKVAQLSDYMAMRFEQLWKEQFDTSGRSVGANWHALSQFTIWARAVFGQGGETPLLHTGKLRDSLSIVQDDETTYTVRVSDPLALLFEYGFTVDVTPGTPKGDAVRRFFSALGWPLGMHTTKLMIPARPIFGPLLSKLSDDVSQYASNLFGRPIRVSISMEVQST